MTKVYRGQSVFLYILRCRTAGWLIPIYAVKAPRCFCFMRNCEKIFGLKGRKTEVRKVFRCAFQKRGTGNPNSLSPSSESVLQKLLCLFRFVSALRKVPSANPNQSNSVCLHPLNPAYQLQQLSHIPALQSGLAFSPQPALHSFEHAHKHIIIATPKITTLIFFFIVFPLSEFLFIVFSVDLFLLSVVILAGLLFLFFSIFLRKKSCLTAAVNYICQTGCLFSSVIFH